MSNGESWAKALSCAVPARFFESVAVSNNEQSNDVIQTPDAENRNSDVEMQSADETSLSASVELSEKPKDVISTG